jgi:hypothetical protein
MRGLRFSSGVWVVMVVLTACQGDATGSTPSTPASPPSTEVPSNGAVAFSAVYVTASPSRVISRADRRDIYLSLPGQDPRRIVGSDRDGIDQSCPAFSPDGTRLAYLEGPGGLNQLVTALDVVKVDDSGAPTGIVVRVAGDKKGELVGCPQWSPDGRQLAIVEEERGMLIATLDGRSHTISFGSFRHGYHAGLRPFAWSPDGSTLAVIDAGTVWLVPVHGGEARTVWTPVGRQIPRAIAWTPDGSRLAIGWDVGPAMSCCDGHRPFLAIVDTADGSRTALPTAGDPSGDIIEQVAWLPGQGRIFVNYLYGGPVLVVRTRGAPTVLELDVQPASGLIVSPDGRWLVYVAFNGNSYAVAAEPLDGGLAPVFYSPWTFGVEYAGDFSWRPIYP